MTRPEYTDMDTLSLELMRIAASPEDLQVLAKMVHYFPSELEKNIFYLRHLVESGTVPHKDTWETDLEEWRQKTSRY